MLNAPFLPDGVPATLSPRQRAPDASVAAGFVRGILSSLEFQPQRQRELLEHAKLATSLLDLDCSAGSRIPLARYIALYRQVVIALADEGFGLFSRPLRPGCFAWLARSSLPARNLRQVLERLTELFSLLQDNVRLDVTADPAGMSLSVAVIQPLPVNHAGFVFAHEWLLRLIHGLAAWLVAHPLPLDRASFPYPPPDHAADYELLFAAQVRFNATQMLAHFPNDWLLLPVQRGEDDLIGFLQNAPASTSMLYRDDRRYAPRVRRLLRAALPGFLSLDESAARLNLSPRTLHRRLADEGQLQLGGGGEGDAFV